MTEANVEPFIIDGGYLSFIYGSEGFASNAWGKIRRNYSIAAGGIIMMDHLDSHRRDYFPAYKSGRVERREADEAVMARRKRVEYFREHVLVEDPSMITIRKSGFEADDLVAAFIMKQYVPHLKVIGTDKDLMQMNTKHFTLQMVKGKNITREKFRKKLPKSVQPWMKTGRDLLICLAMLGDTSDSVPRIVPSGQVALKEFVQIASHPKPFAQLVTKYGKAVKTNLYLTALPGPWVYDPIPDEDDLIELYDSPYWETPLEYGLKLQPEIEKMFEESLQRVQIAGVTLSGDFPTGILEDVVERERKEQRTAQILKELGYDPNH